MKYKDVRVAVISTHTPHARRDAVEVKTSKMIEISTHTPHARRDAHAGRQCGMAAEISTHTPHARRD